MLQLTDANLDKSRRGSLDHKNGSHDVNMTNDLARDFFEILGLARRGLSDPCYGTVPANRLAHCVGRLMRFLNVEGTRERYATADSEDGDDGRFFEMGVSDERLLRQGHALLALFQAASLSGSDVHFA